MKRWCSFCCKDREFQELKGDEFAELRGNSHAENVSRHTAPSSGIYSPYQKTETQSGEIKYIMGGKEVFWTGMDWVTYGEDIRLYKGITMIEALKILTEGIDKS